MIVIQMLLPRFLVLEVVLFFHFLQLGQCSKKVSTSVDTKDEVKRKNSTGHLRDIGESFFRNETVDSNGENLTSCSINLNEINIKWMPLFYSMKNNYYLMPTVDASLISESRHQRKNKRKHSSMTELNSNQSKQKIRRLHFENGTNDILSTCPGTHFKETNKRSQFLKCVDGKLVSDESKTNKKVRALSEREVKLSDLACKKSIKETIVTTDDACGPSSGNGKLTHIGWIREQENASSFTPQITVCHDTQKESTYYANHTLYGLSIQARDKGESRYIPFKEGGKQFYSKSSAAKAYKITSQKHLFKRLFGNSEERSKIFNPGKKHNLYLSKGHLSPEADFIWKEWQDASNYYFNAAPQWQSINNGNWKAIEEAVRKYAYKNRVSLKIFTGTEGQLRLGKSDIPISLANDMNNAEKISNDLIPVPLHFWKLVYSFNQNAAIIFVGVNDPHFNTTADDLRSVDYQYKSLCPKDDRRLCEHMGWNFPHNKNYHKGLIYCCSISGFNEVLSWIPHLSNIPDNPDILSMRP